MEEGGVVSQLSCSSSEHQLPVLMPSRVGRDFVRQYYRLLRKAPELLHRFYTNESTCTHGDIDMALGMRDIQALFRRENYMECKTKILHVDIHGTLTDGVIVLVTGEQSNAEFPMRPFVQTFVLASQGPRRYYVLNDIFRYTDEIVNPNKVNDVECQTSAHHIGDGDQECFYTQQETQEEKVEIESGDRKENYEIYTEVTKETSSTRLNISEFCSIPMPRWANNSRQFNETKMNNCPQQCNEETSDEKSETTTTKSDDQQQGRFLYRSLIAQALAPGLDFEDVATRNNYEGSEFCSEEVNRVSIGVSSVRGLKRHEVDLLGTQLKLVSNNQESNEEIPYVYQQVDDSQFTPTESEEQMPTYAKLLMSAFTRASIKNNNEESNMTSSATPKPMTIHTFNNNNDNIQSHETLANSQTVMTSCPDNSFSVPSPTQSLYPMQRKNYNQNVRRNDRRRTNSAQKYEDNQQLFLGQIPHNATEEELINIFSCFGNVLELRILPNLGGKVQPGAKHPLKYGFLTFEHVESVKACLESRPVFFPNNSPDGQKLNVRAKKPSVPRNETPSTCQTLENQPMSSEWLKASSSNRRNTSVQNMLVNNSNTNNNSNNNNAGSSNVFTRKEKNSLDSGSGTQNQGGKKFVPTSKNAGSVSGTCDRR